MDQGNATVGKLANHTGEFREILAKPTQMGAEDRSKTTPDRTVRISSPELLVTHIGPAPSRGVLHERIAF